MSISLAPQFTQRTYVWASWKSVLLNKNFIFQYDDDGTFYTIWGYDGPEVHVTQIWKGTIPDSVIDNSAITQNQNDIDKTDFETNYKSLGNKPINQITTDGRTRISAEKTNSSTVTFYSHDWCDKTTWYEKATRVIENATNSGDNLTYNLNHTNVIDTYHGKITAEDYMKSIDGYSYRVSIKVDGYAKLEQDPHYATGNDYIVDYKDGYVTFLSEQDPASVVSVIYYYATISQFTVKPGASKQLRIVTVEVQFSDDVIANDSVIFQPYGFVESFAPQYCTTNGGPYPPGTKIPLGNPLIYKTIQDLLNDSNKTYPAYPALGGSGWRAITRPSVVMDWDYTGEKILRSDMGMEIRVSLQHNSPFGGTFATATFYCTSENLT